MSTQETDAEGTEHARRDLRLFFAPLACLVVCLVLFPAFTVLYQAYEANQIKAYEAQAQAQNNHKFCGVVDAALTPRPPAGSTAGKPGQAYEQNFHATFVALKVKLGC